MTTDIPRRAQMSSSRTRPGDTRLPEPKLSAESARLDKINDDEFERQARVYTVPDNLRPALFSEDEIAKMRTGYSTGGGRLHALVQTRNAREAVWQIRLGLIPFDPPTPAQTAEADEFFAKFGTRLATEPRVAPPNPLKTAPAAASAASNTQSKGATVTTTPASNFTDDLDIVDPTAVETPARLYPVGQWLHGDPKLAAGGGVAHTGGLILPVKYLEDDLAPAAGWTRTTIAFGSGKSEMVLASSKPALAIVRTRFRWFIQRGAETIYFPRADYQDGKGMRGHLQALCAVYGYDFPVVFTFKGKASQVLEIMLRDFAAKVAEAAAKATRPAAGGPAPRAFPRFAWYMKFQAGPHSKAGRQGQESIITPPESLLPQVVDAAYLAKIYVGRERLLALQQLYHDAGEWAAQWNNGQAVAASEPSDEGEIEEPF